MVINAVTFLTTQRILRAQNKWDHLECSICGACKRNGMAIPAKQTAVRSILDLWWSCSSSCPRCFISSNDLHNCGFLECSSTKVLTACVRSYPTLCDPMSCSPPGSPVHRILQARKLEWAATPFSREGAYGEQLDSGHEHVRYFVTLQNPWAPDSLHIVVCVSISLSGIRRCLQRLQHLV